jgi:hypothetical protein
MANNRKHVPRWFTITAVVAIIWNLLGVSAFVMQILMTPEMLAQLPPAERELYESTPVWVTGVFAVAVFGGLLGSLGLVLRKVWSLLFLWLSLFAVLAQNTYGLLMSNALEVLGPQALVMPGLVIGVAILLVLMARNANTRHWLD